MLALGSNRIEKERTRIVLPLLLLLLLLPLPISALRHPNQGELKVQLNGLLAVLGLLCDVRCAMCSGSHPANLTERLLPAITANREQQSASSKLKHTNTDRREKKEHSVNSSIDRGKRTGRQALGIVKQ